MIFLELAEEERAADALIFARDRLALVITNPGAPSFLQVVAHPPHYDVGQSVL